MHDEQMTLFEGHPGERVTVKGPLAHGGHYSVVVRTKEHSVPTLDGCATTMLLCALVQVTQPLCDTCPICGNRRPVLEAPVPSLPVRRVVIHLVPKWEKGEGTAPYTGAGVPVLLHPTMDLARQLENVAFILRRRRHTEVVALKVRKKQLQLGVFFYLSLQWTYLCACGCVPVVCKRVC